MKEKKTKQNKLSKLRSREVFTIVKKKSYWVQFSLSGLNSIYV